MNFVQGGKKLEEVRRPTKHIFLSLLWRGEQALGACATRPPPLTPPLRARCRGLLSCAPAPCRRSRACPAREQLRRHVPIGDGLSRSPRRPEGDSLSRLSSPLPLASVPLSPSEPAETMLKTTTAKKTLTTTARSLTRKSFWRSLARISKATMTSLAMTTARNRLASTPLPRAPGSSRRRPTRKRSQKSVALSRRRRATPRRARARAKTRASAPMPPPPPTARPLLLLPPRPLPPRSLRRPFAGTPPAPAPSTPAPPPPVLPPPQPPPPKRKRQNSSPTRATARATTAAAAETAAGTASGALSSTTRPRRRSPRPRRPSRPSSAAASPPHRRARRRVLRGPGSHIASTPTSPQRPSTRSRPSATTPPSAPRQASRTTCLPRRRRSTTRLATSGSSPVSLLRGAGCAASRTRGPLTWPSGRCGSSRRGSTTSAPCRTSAMRTSRTPACSSCCRRALSRS